MSIQAYGAPAGATCIYFHGAPGGPEECAWFDQAAAQANVRLLAVDRAAVAPGLDGEAYFDALATEVSALAGAGPATLLGFSVGAFVAVQVAARLATAPAALHLVSPAAPLQPGDLDAMAGGPVFRIAQSTPSLFSMATALQGVLFRAAPRAVFRALFADAKGAEADVAADPGFREAVISLMRRSYGERRPGYVRDVLLYVRPWADAFERLPTAATVWQGDGDTWTPPAMARRIAALGPAGGRLTMLPGLGHYSCLFAAAPRILAEVGRVPPS